MKFMQKREKISHGKGKGMLSVGILCLCLLAGCGKKEESAPAVGAETDAVETEEMRGAAEENVKEAETEETKDIKETGYVFESNGVKLTVDMNMEGILDRLGEPNSSYEQPSCAAQGIAKIYTYSGFEIETYPDGDADLIACIVLKDDSVATSEGIDLSMTKEDIIAAYGLDYEESETSMVYEKDGTKLCFILDGEDISSIEYDSPVLN